MMKVITGDKYKDMSGIAVVCDPECLKGIKISIGERVIYDGEEYILRGAIPPTPTGERWIALLDPASSPLLKSVEQSVEQQAKSVEF